MTMTLLETRRGRIYLAVFVVAGLLLLIAPILPWLTYYLKISQGGTSSEVWVYVTGFGSISTSSGVAGVSFSFSTPSGWWYGDTILVIGILTLLTSLVVFRSPETAGLIGFLLGFINMTPFTFFLGRVTDLGTTMNLFAQAVQGAGYSFLAGNSSYAIGFIIDLIGTALLPISSILIVSNATRLRIGKREEEERKRKQAEDDRTLPEH